MVCHGACRRCHRYLFAKTKGYTDAKLCWAPRGARPPLSMLPQLSSLFAEAEEAFAYIDGYVRRCQADLCECLRADRIPTAPLIEAIAVAKVRRVAFACACACASRAVATARPQ